jgi:DNA helicase HerA-like ATPase
MLDSLKFDPTIRGDSREYLKITPSGAQYPTETIPEILASLHTLEPTGTEHGFVGRLTNRQTPATFTFSIITRGDDAPVEFYLGSDANLSALADRLRNIYPQSFNINRVECDLLKQLIEPVEYSREEFEQRLTEDALYYEPITEPTPSEADTTGQERPEEETEHTERGEKPESTPISDGGTATATAADQSALSERHIDYAGGTFELAPSTELPRSSAPITDLERPTLTTDGTILARPMIPDETVDLHGVTWNADTPKQHADYMTTAMTLNEWYAEQDSDDDDDVADAPLGALTEALVDAEHPIGFRVQFQRFPDWTSQAEQRRLAIHEGDNIGLPARIGKWIAEMVFGPPPREVREASRRTRAFDRNDGPNEGSENDRRLERLNDSRPSQSFQVNVSAIGIVPRDRYDETETNRMARALERLRSTLDPLGSPFYTLMSTQHGPGGLMMTPARGLVRRFADPTYELQTGRTIRNRRQHPRPDFIFSPDELAPFILAPSASRLSDSAARSVQARQESRTPELGPAPKHMEHLTNGLALGTLTNQSSTETIDPESDAVHVPPPLLSYHYLRAAISGAGKSIGVQNDGLSLAEDTQGPTIMVDAKGGDMLENFMRAYGKRYGMDRLEEDILYFPVPEILPGLTIFDVRDVPSEKRDQAIRERAAYYEEILKLVMGAESYSEAKNAPQFIRALIEALFDAEHGCENGRYRASTEYFAHDQLDHVIDEFERAVRNTPGGSLPESTKDHVIRALQRRSGYNEKTVRNILTGVTTRTGKISEDSDIRPLFNNVEQTFDFGDLLDTDKKVLFDLGELRSGPSKIMAGVLLTSLYDELKKHKDQLKAKPDDYVVNFLIDEAPSVTISDTMTTLLSEGREFRISIGLSAQFPEQLRLEGGESVYLNALNNIGTKIIGKVSIDDDIAEALATEDMPPAAVKERFRAMPRGEFFVGIPSSAFGETGPQPFSVDPMPIPSGHPKSDDPLTAEEENRFQAAVEHVKTRTREEYGIVEEDLSLLTEVPTDVCEIVGATTGDLDHVVTQLVADAQRREDVRETNGSVSVAMVNDTLEQAYKTVDCLEEFPDRDELLTIENRSYLLKPDRPIPDSATNTHDRETSEEPTEESIVQIRLSDAGQDLIATDDATGHQTEGSKEHSDALEDLQTALDPYGWKMNIVDQTGDELPDARAYHPDLDKKVHFEMELSTADKPSKVLANFQKAQAADAVPVFMVRAHPEELAYWARTVNNILRSPVKHTTSDRKTYYTTDDHLTIAGARSTDEPVTMLRPVADETDSRHSVWTRDATGETVEYVLTDAAGNEYLRTTDLTTIQLTDFPGYMWENDTDGAIMVSTGESTTRYESDENFKSEWVKVRQPFNPASDLPNPDYTQEDYVIGLMPTKESEVLAEPAVYDPDEETVPLETLVDAVKHAARSRGKTSTKNSSATTASDSSTDEPSTNDDIDSEAVIEEFAATCLVVDEESSVTPSDMYAAYTVFTTANDYSTEPKNWMSRRLGDHISFTRTTKRIGDGTARIYQGIDLVPPNQW